MIIKQSIYNVSYRFISKLLAARLYKIIPRLISSIQVALQKIRDTVIAHDCEKSNRGIYDDQIR